MLAKRIIPCLDVTGGRVVKGVNFVELRDAGDPVEIAARYNEQGADELTFLDITASSDERDILLHVIEAVASKVFIPLTVGGGVRKVEDVRRLLNAGADKVSINTAAVQNPDLVRDASSIVGSQAIVIAIDATLKLAQALKTPIIASGGLTSIADVQAICTKLVPEGIIGAIAGRALYEGKLDLKAAQAAADKALGKA